MKTIKKTTKKTTKKRTNKKLVKKWIEALESGKYKKCRGVLHRTKNTFCALGVLCDVYDPTKWEKYDSIYRYYYSTCPVVPSFIVNNINMQKEVYSTIVDLNDTKKKSFKEIAKYLRELYNIKD